MPQVIDIMAIPRGFEPLTHSLEGSWSSNVIKAHSDKKPYFGSLTANTHFALSEWVTALSRTLIVPLPAS